MPTWLPLNAAVAAPVESTPPATAKQGLGARPLAPRDTPTGNGAARLEISATSPQRYAYTVVGVTPSGLSLQFDLAPRPGRCQPVDRPDLRTLRRTLILAPMSLAGSAASTRASSGAAVCPCSARAMGLRCWPSYFSFTPCKLSGAPAALPAAGVTPACRAVVTAAG